MSLHQTIITECINNINLFFSPRCGVSIASQRNSSKAEEEEHITVIIIVSCFQLELLHDCFVFIELSSCAQAA